MPFPLFFALAAALGGREIVRDRRAGRRMIDQEAERLEVINNIDLGIGTMGASNIYDARKIAALYDQQTTAQAMLSSKDPKQREIGGRLLQGIRLATLDGIQQNETESREDAVREKDREIVSLKNRTDREIAMSGQLNVELRPFMNAKTSYDKVINLLDNNTFLSSISALVAFIQAIDDSVVREGELLKYTGSNGMIEQYVNAVNKASGRDMTVGMKNDIRNAAAAIINAEKTRAMVITNSFQDRATAFGLSAEKVMSGIDPSLYTLTPINREAEIEAQAAADLAEKAQQRFVPFDEAVHVDDNLLDTIGRFTVGKIGKGAAILADKALQAWQETGRDIQGATLHIDPQTGEIWEQDANGKWTLIEGTPDQKRQAQIFRAGANRAELPPDTQRRADEQDRAERDARRQPGLFQQGGFFDRDKP